MTNLEEATAIKGAHQGVASFGMESRPPGSHDELAAVRIGPPEVLDGPVTLVEYDPAWPELYALEADRVRAALAERALLLAHVGSTSVPGLAAKPRIDIVLAVDDSRDEPRYVAALECAGYVLRIREPDWHEHRLFKRRDVEVNLHVFSAGCVEIDRMIGFRDRLRGDPADRALYERTKRDLAARTWKDTQQYANAKTTIVEEILERASAPRV
jgi:GrpB-like predicted nucleotidyltransferase (UPF0157 family)